MFDSFLPLGASELLPAAPQSFASSPIKWVRIVAATTAVIVVEVVALVVAVVVVVVVRPSAFWGVEPSGPTFQLLTADYSCCSCKLVCRLPGGRIPATLRRSEMAPAVAAVAIVVVVAAAQATASSSRSSSSSSVPLSLPLTADDLPNQYSFWQHNHSEFKACAHPHPYSVG